MCRQVNTLQVSVHGKYDAVQVGPFPGIEILLALDRQACGEVPPEQVEGPSRTVQRTGRR